MKPTEIIKCLRVCATDGGRGKCDGCPYNVGTYDDGCAQLLIAAADLLSSVYEQPQRELIAPQERRQRFQELFAGSGLNQSQAAKLLFVSPSAISRIIVGPAIPGMDLLIRAEAILGAYCKERENANE